MGVPSQARVPERADAAEGAMDCSLLLMLVHRYCAGEEDLVDSRTIYMGHWEPPPGAEAYIPQRYNRIVSRQQNNLLQVHILGLHTQ